MTSDSPAGDLLPGDLAWVRRLARRMLRDESLADDVAQDVWIAARQHGAPAPAATGGLRAWLRVVTTNRVRRLLRTDRRRAARERFATSDAPRTAASPADVVERAALHRETMDAVMALDEPYREALLLRHLDDLPATTIAERQGITHAAARQRLSRATQMLRERLERTHAGGFAAWCAAWSRDLGPGAAAAGSATVLATVFTMKAIHVVAGLGLLAALAWIVWPATDAPLPAGRSAALDPSARVANAANREPVDPAAARVAVGVDARVVEVVDETASPVADVVVVALADRELVRSARTDANGRAPMPATVVADEILVAARGRVPLRVARADTDVQRVAWPAGAVVTGTLRGGAGDVELVLEHDSVPPSLDGLGPRALETLSELGIDPGSLRIAVSPDGPFTFAGLTTDWSGAISAGAFTMREPSGLGAVDRGLALVLREPASGLVLELVAPIPVTGRVVVDRTPVADVSVWIDSQTFGAPRVAARSRDDGTFVVGLRRGDPGTVRGALMVAAADDSGVLATRVLHVPADAVRHDLGDIVVGAPLEVRVVDTAGAPIAAAIVAVVKAGGAASQVRSDADGVARFVATEVGADRVSVEARGFARCSRSIGAERTITIALEPSNEVVVVVRDQHDRPVRGSLRVSADRLPFVVRTDVAPADAAATEARNAPFRIDRPLGRDGTVVLQDLVPGTALQCVVVDGSGKQLERVEVIAPPSLRSDTMLIHVQSAAAPVVLVVRDDRGRPVARARVHAEAADWHVSGRTDAKGTFVFDGLSKAQNCSHFEVAHPAFVTFVRTDAVVAPDTGPMEVTLHPGRRLVVNVRQANGAAVRASYVTIGGGPAGLATADGPGRYVFDTIARLAGEVQVVLDGGRTFRRSVTATAEVAEVVVPDLADVGVALADDLTLARGSMLHLRITPVDPAGEPARRVVRPEELQARSFELQMPPGRYRLQLESRRGRTAQAIGEPRDVELAAGTIRISLP